MRNTTSLVLRRLAFVPVAILMIITVAFFLLRAVPGDPAEQIAGQYASSEQVDAIRDKLGLDDPVMTQYADYMSGVMRGDLGASYFTGRPIVSTIAERLPATLDLVALAFGIAFVVGLGVGGLAAYRRGTRVDGAMRTIITVQQSVPEFVLALLLILVFYATWRVTPSPVGRIGIGQTAIPSVTNFLYVDAIIAGEWKLLLGALHRSVLPAASIGLIAAAGIAKTTRSVLGTTLASPQVEFARAQGLPERTVLRYAFATGRTPILTYAAILIAGLIGGTVIIETIFSWGGLAQWGLEAIIDQDMPAVQGFILVMATVTVLVYFVLDLVVLLLDPRVSYR